MNPYPKWFYSVLMGALLVLLCTGLLLAPTTLVTRAEMDLAWRLPPGARVPVTMLHVLVGFLMAALGGALWSIHMRNGWRARIRRRSGGLLAGSLVALTFTGIIAAYAGEDTLGATAALGHLAFGMAGVVPFGVHAFRKRRARTPSARRAMQA